MNLHLPKNSTDSCFFLNILFFIQEEVEGHSPTAVCALLIQQLSSSFQSLGFLLNFQVLCFGLFIWMIGEEALRFAQELVKKLQEMSRFAHKESRMDSGLE